MLRALAAALAVLAALLTPAVLARAGAEPTPPARQLADTALPAEGPGARDWTALECRRDLCGAPVALRLHGRLYERGPGTGQAVERRDVRSRTVRWTLRQTRGRGHSVLVGALRSSSASDLVVELGTAPAVAIPPGRLTLLEVPPDVTTVTLVERGRPSASEELRIQEYTER